MCQLDKHDKHVKAGGRRTALRLDDMVADYVRDAKDVRIVVTWKICAAPLCWNAILIWRRSGQTSSDNCQSLNARKMLEVKGVLPWRNRESARAF